MLQRQILLTVKVEEPDKEKLTSWHCSKYCPYYAERHIGAHYESMPYCQIFDTMLKTEDGKALRHDECLFAEDVLNDALHIAKYGRY